MDACAIYLKRFLGDNINMNAINITVINTGDNLKLSNSAPHHDETYISRCQCAGCMRSFYSE